MTADGDGRLHIFQMTAVQRDAVTRDLNGQAEWLFELLGRFRRNDGLDECRFGNGRGNDRLLLAGGGRLCIITSPRGDGETHGGHDHPNVESSPRWRQTFHALDAFNQCGDALSYANAHRGEAVLSAVSFQSVQEGA